MRERANGVGGEVVQEACALSGQHGVEEVEQRPDGDEGADDDGSTPVPAPDRQNRSTETDEHGRQVDRGQARGDVERLPRGDLPHHGNRDAGLEVGERSDPHGEEQRRGQTLDAAQRAYSPSATAAADQIIVNHKSEADAWCESSSSGSARRTRGPGNAGLTR